MFVVHATAFTCQCVSVELQLGQRLHLESLMQREPASLASGNHIKGSVIIDSTAKIGNDCLIGPDVSIGPNCVIGNGVRLANCVVMQGCQVCADAEHVPVISRQFPLILFLSAVMEQCRLIIF
jgi:UDP-3-O-[3-hydroxymyristoyl] glucosamine N-acyltransferase